MLLKIVPFHMKLRLPFFYKIRFTFGYGFAKLCKSSAECRLRQKSKTVQSERNGKNGSLCSGTWLRFSRCSGNFLFICKRAYRHFPKNLKSTERDLRKSTNSFTTQDSTLRIKLSILNFVRVKIRVFSVKSIPLKLHFMKLPGNS